MPGDAKPDLAEQLQAFLSQIDRTPKPDKVAKRIALYAGAITSAAAAVTVLAFLVQSYVVPYARTVAAVVALVASATGFGAMFLKRQSLGRIKYLRYVLATACFATLWAAILTLQQSQPLAACYAVAAYLVFMSLILVIDDRAEFERVQRKFRFVAAFINLTITLVRRQEALRTSSQTVILLMLAEAVKAIRDTDGDVDAMLDSVITHGTDFQNATEQHAEALGKDAENERKEFKNSYDALIALMPPERRPDSVSSQPIPETIAEA